MEPHHTGEDWCHFGDISTNVNWTPRAPCKSRQYATVAYTVSAVQVTKMKEPNLFLPTSECCLRQADKFISLMIYQILTIHLWPSDKEKLCSWAQITNRRYGPIIYHRVHLQILVVVKLPPEPVTSLFFFLSEKKKKFYKISNQQWSRQIPDRNYRHELFYLCMESYWGHQLHKRTWFSAGRTKLRPLSVSLVTTVSGGGSKIMKLKPIRSQPVLSLQNSSFEYFIIWKNMCFGIKFEVCKYEIIR